MKAFPFFRSVLVHSNVFIALGAAASTAQSLWIWKGKIFWHPLIAVVFFGSWAMYTLHRSIGLYRVMQKVQQIPGRFKQILHHRVFFFVLGILSTLACLYFLFWQCSPRSILLFLPALAVAFIYAVPVFGGKRLRDFGMIKVPVLALTWAWLTALIPLQTMEWPPDTAGYLFFAERFFFLVGITLPFEVRDAKVDLEEGVYTLVHFLGIPGIKQLAVGLSLLGIGSSALLFVIHFYDLSLLLALLASWICVLLLLGMLDRNRSAVYYELGLDGMLLLQAGLVCLGIWAF